MMKLSSLSLNTSYQSKITDGDIAFDTAQEAIINHLEALRIEIENQSLKPPHQNLLSRFFKKEKRKAFYSKGLYIWGGVGRGKTMLMDLFFDHVLIEKKERFHFHAFMQMVHHQLFIIRRENESENALLQVIKNIAQDIKLLCLDEFMVTDIADAMIMARLFEGLFEQGVILVTTSNTPPERLYQNGLQYARFQPFIPILYSYVKAVQLENEQDYRLAAFAQEGHYLSPINKQNCMTFDKRWAMLKGEKDEKSFTLSLKGREWVLPQSIASAYGLAVRVDFAELCKKARGTPDYLALAQQCPIIFIENIPILQKHERNEAKRFILLIDTLYDHHNAVVILAETAPQNLYKAGDHASEFERTASRLMEMQGQDYFDMAMKEKTSVKRESSLT